MYSCPFFSVVINGQIIRVGIPQGPDANTSQVALGFLPEGEVNVDVVHSPYSQALSQESPRVHIFELQAEHPLLSDFFFPSLPHIGEKTYQDSPDDLGYREDASVGLDAYFFLDDEECVEIINGVNLKERKGDPNRILRGRAKRHEYLSSSDIDAKQVAKASREDASCKEVGYQKDVTILGHPFLSHRVYIDKHFDPSQNLGKLHTFKNVLQEVGEHGMVERVTKAPIAYSYIPQFSGYEWRGQGWNRAVGVENIRQLLLTGAISPQDQLIQDFADREFEGNVDLLIDPSLWAR
jgi:hypothetical protein